MGCGIPALPTTWLLAGTLDSGDWDWELVTRVRVTEDVGLVSLTACPVFGSMSTSD